MSEQTISRLADLEEIRDLPRLYAHYVWQKDTDQAVALFAADGTMDAGDGNPIGGHDALREGYERMLAAGELQPFVHNHVIELDGDQASGTVYLDLRATMGGTAMIGSGYYDDCYVREQGRWRFRSRVLTLRFFVPLDEGWAGAKQESVLDVVKRAREGE